ncbi:MULTISPECIES: NAD(P)H-dependent glycerol-3-phosphate dehydrogenase [Enterococcus]|uniref:Glycerol-3-phosphate dehydrogenase [NAD(P)+] n=1 Tax=Enterococcus malodoratus ATCC 43197 TaxID=1158601 RepID=R2RBS0_9ENTE|nr:MULTISPECIES: NAD(P)H-dependent glycerol-3-phosphate dehydrogenase [Enterococcus]BBM19190.1 glycerol-3-phosphate dehydrogenase [NAD(P)+] [Enterococcus avium]EOH81140.1 glycerol-3-phosphate dehydrogenase [NAD(P)+] [Enterococcus malodoratus ATCC 43197]EOT69650.1 glycerol-3-phosphate dehydrogenase [NAD(P)+] [Enterococcus malodoratus ATCC 43197]OJG60357.1 glycerol-3-phosphate dehydrogenase [Enterococcus malodoratus]SPX01289.1 glycerol-3-phosphate dehydrogenase (NAD(P)(+)) [Enterococcus malodora
MKQKVAVLGPGSWGTALAQVLAENGHEVRIWGNHEAQIDEINTYHTNRHYLPDLKIPDSIKGEKDLKEAVKDADAVLFVVPTKAIRSVAQEFAKVAENKPVIIHASKGLEQDTHKRISEVLIEEIPEEHRQGVVVLSGPSHAEEVAVHDITTITAACKDQKLAEYVQKLFMNEYLRIYTNPDVIGVEMGAALKNIIALGAGALAGLSYGDDAKAAIMTRGLAEISRLGVEMGANPLTFIGLSGVGDLIVTCTSVHSRNWRAGNLLGKGHKLDEVLDNMGMIVEGVSTTKAAKELADSMNVSMPITETIYDVLYNDKDVRQACRDLMMREGTFENEFTLE